MKASHKERRTKRKRSSESSKEAEWNERLIRTLGQALATAANESAILLRLEEFFSPNLANLVRTKAEADELNTRVAKAVESLGGPPRLIIQWHDKPKPRYDTYPGAAFGEAMALFRRARTSVARAHMYYVALGTDERFPDLMKFGKARPFYVEHIQHAFWEHAETSFIRLASYWDRIGQLLDFAFFRVRQFERDGYSAVVDRIHNNWSKVLPALGDLPSWKKVRAYQTSEQVDGLKWLLRRRNLLVHSLHLRPLTDDSDESLFDSAFNHLDDSVKRKLIPGTMNDEIARLHSHLRTAAEQFADATALAELAAELCFRPLHDD